MKASCGLCKEERELQNSHYMSAGLFKAVIQGHAPYDAAPVMVSVTKGTAVRSNHQPTKPYLCIDCEQRFSALGENEVIANCHAKDGRFGLRDKLRLHPPSLIRKSRKIYHGHDLEGALSVAAYGYFALSVLWRGSSTDWHGFGSDYRFALGKKYEEDFRLYLLGEKPFPERVAVSVYVDFDEPTQAVMSPPNYEQIDVEGRRHHQHSFMIPGVRFIVLVGGDPGGLTGPSHPDPSKVTFFEWRFSGTAYQKNIAEHVQRVTPKGVLAREAERRG